MANISMQWIDEVRGADSIREVARRVGMNQGTLNRQINLDQLTFETVVAVARAYERPVIASLVATGFLTREDAGLPPRELALQNATDQELVDEISRRLQAMPATGTAYDIPIGEAVTNVHRFPNRNVGADTQDLDEVASESISPRPEGETDADFDA